MADFLKDKTLKYLNRDFNSFKKDLIRYTQAHNSGAISDFNETSPGMALLELNAFIGDNLSFYLDQAFNELKQETARQEKNVVAFANSLGYRAKGPRAARGTVHFMIEVPSTTNEKGEIVPDELFSPILLKGARVEGPNGTSFETLENIVFSSSIGRAVTGSQFDATTGTPTHFALRKPVDIVAGETKTDTFTISEFEQFKTLELANENVLEVISVVDSDGNEWTEVDYLAQDTVFDEIVNTEDDSEEVPYVLKLVTVPRRFITSRDPSTEKTSLVFGSGDGVDFDDELIPNVADLALPLSGRRTFSAYAIDPQNFLKTRSLGLSPFNTTLTVEYRVGGGLNTNVPIGSIRSVADAELSFASNTLDAQTRSSVEGSLECVNLDKTDGGAAKESISEIKANSGAWFAAQNRVVTKDDFIVRILSMPERFGKLDKVFPKRNNINPLATDVMVLSRDSNGKLSVASSTLKQNIKTYISKFRMLTDGVNILDADILNLSLSFGVVVASKFNRSEVLTKCLSVARDYLDVDIQQIGQPIVLSDLSAELQNVLGVVSVYELSFKNMVGTVDGFEYSSTRFDVSSNTRNNIIYCPDTSIFEVKFPNKDIIGVAK